MEWLWVEFLVGELETMGVSNRLVRFLRVTRSISGSNTNGEVLPEFRVRMHYLWPAQLTHPRNTKADMQINQNT